MSSLATAGVESWTYREMGLVPIPASEETAGREVVPPASSPGVNEAEVADRVHHAVVEAQQRWAAEAQQRDMQRNAQLAAVLESFSTQRSRYFRQVESDVVQLALAVARKILQREAALDATLLHGLVRIALDRVGADEKVRVRLSPEQVHGWSRSHEEGSAVYRYELIADPSLPPGDCVLETDRGLVSCGIEEQLKGIEQSFCDLLARRPEVTP